MAEFTGNVHSLQLTLPFPTPQVGSPAFAIGRTFGDIDSMSDGLDVWIDEAALTNYDPPDGPEIINLPVSSILACVHGWLRYVPTGKPILDLTTRTGEPLLAAGDALVLSVWPTLRDNLERMAEDGSVLVPQPESGKGGRPALEHLIYDNVGSGAVKPAIEDLIREARPDPLFTDAERTEMANSFMAGELQILARAGRMIGRAAGGETGGVSRPDGAGPGWDRITFRAVDRLGQLFDPGYFFRRIRDLAEVVEVPILVDKTLIPSRDAIKQHPLPGLTLPRRIVDWRDVRGRPMVDTPFIFVPTGTGNATTVPKTTNAWGLWIGPAVSAGNDPLAVEDMDLVTTVDDVVIGTLPHALRSAAALTRPVLADDYLVVSSLNLADWFPQRTAPTLPDEEPLRRYTTGNRVTALVDGRDTFWEMFKAMRRTFRDDVFTDLGPGDELPAEGALLADAPTHWIRIAGWQLSPHLYMRDLPEEYTEIEFDESGVPTTGDYDPQAHVMGVLRAAVAAGVEVRALLWRQLQVDPNYHTNNVAAVAAINGLSSTMPPLGQAILDDVGRTTGSHHQKAVVTENADGRVAFVGGIDLALGRWDSTEHRPNDSRSQNGRTATDDEPWLGWHDVHCRIQGPAVDDVELNFRQRWNHNPDAETDDRTLTPAPAEPIEPIADASHFVQINRTIPPGLAAYTFVPQDTGDAGIRAARLNAIRKARRFIYLEDQYLTMVNGDDYAALLASASPLTFEPTDREAMAAALRERLVGPDPVQFVAILIPRTLVEEPAFANMVLYEMRRRFLTFLTHGLTDEEKRERLLVFHLRNEAGVSTYVHAKTIVVDDVWASIGSSNMGYRSMTYDTEINCDVVDGAITRGSRPFARDLRVRLWAEHLRLLPKDHHLVVDPRKGFELLRRAAETDWPRPNHVQRYDPEYYGDDLSAPDAPPLYDSTNTNHEIVRQHFVDPDGREPDDPTLDYAALLAIIQSL
jgi:phosphatidylserine/phosphatidylglycerophosphate/cardiolipin synthase-like enzyme